MALPLAPPEVEATLNRLAQEGRVARTRDWYLDAATWSRIVSHAQAVLAEYHDSHPLRPGMPAEEIRQQLALPHAPWQALLEKLLETGELERQDALVALAGRNSGLGLAQEQVQQVRSLLAQGRFSPPAAAAVVEATRSSLELLEAMARSGDVVRVDQALYFEKSIYDEMVERTVSLIKRNGSVSVAQLRDDLGTSRKHALAFLEHLDTERITVRTGEARVLGSRAPACA